MDNTAVDAARTNAQSTAQTAVDYSSKGNTLADELRKAVGERYASSDIAKNTATARTEFMAAAPQARSQVLDLVKGGSILSPTQQNAIMAAKRSSALAPLIGQNLVNDAAFGTMEDIINAGTNAWKAKTEAAQGAAGIAQTGYQNLLSELMQKAQIAQSQQPKTSQWEDSSGHTWLINAVTGEKIQDLGSTYHAPTAGGQKDDWGAISAILGGGAQNTTGGQWVNGQGQKWTDTSKIPVGTFIGGDGKTYTEYSDGSVGTTQWNYQQSDANQKIIGATNNMMKNF